MIKNIRAQYPTIIFFCALSVFYFWHTLDHFTFGDCLDFYISASEGFSINTNAGTHTLFHNLFHLFLNIADWPNPAKASACFVAFFSILSSIFIYKIGLLIGGRNISILITTLWALSFTNWHNSVIIEVYSLNNAFVAAFILLMISDFVQNKNSNSYLAGLILGISLLVHIQNILLIPMFVWYLFSNNGFKINPVAIKSFGVFLLSSSLLFLGPIFDKDQTISDIFFARGFQTTVLQIDYWQIVKGFFQSLGYFAYNFLLAVPIVVIGLFHLYKTNKTILVWLLAGVLPTWFFSMRYAVSDNYVFFMPANLLLVVSAGYGFSRLGQKFLRLQPYAMILFVLHFPMTYYLTWQASERLPVLTEFKELKAYKGGLRYYLWPGMNNNVDAVALAKEIYISGEAPFFMHDFDWQYGSAILYLYKTNQLPHRNFVSKELQSYESWVLEYLGVESLNH